MENKKGGKVGGSFRHTMYGNVTRGGTPLFWGGG